MVVNSKKRILIKPTEYVNFIKKIHLLILYRRTNTIYYNLKTYFYTKNLYKIIKSVTETYKTCLRIKIKSLKIDKKNKIIANYKFERISTDIYESFKLNEYKSDLLREKRYIMHITEINIRFTRLYFLKIIDTKNII